ncbi:hypothetical protein SAMN05443245_5250 [Paraburkholderia fungorum]|uniref:Uncharacterized protein n=1 Tax=Paraburkholderia fungorum TaxID=134537 RepID=A0A1H1IIT1_9BURK|nr:hypothetical protein [Paraburkholderia fungorum]SDR37657.1 hypothetical protein SAMN05443245_5250 [Paraburkholderia fungorum]
MSKVTIKPHTEAPTPTQEVLRATSEEFSVTDSLGRVIVLKKPGVLAQFDLIEALGDLAKNDVYRVMCIPAIYVMSIDGAFAPPPSNKTQMRALIARLGEEGFEAINKGIRERFPQEAESEGDEVVKK